MTSTKIRDFLVEILKQELDPEEVFALGSKIHLFVEDKEFEIVVRTTRPEHRWKDTLDGL
jgi:hypothetical protein